MYVDMNKLIKKKKKKKKSMRRGMGGSWPSRGGLGHPWATYMSPKLFLLLVFLKFPLRDNILKNSFLGIAEEGGPSSISALSWQGAADPTYKGKLSLLFLSLRAHVDTGGVWIIVQHS
jgi:hypothetical protein